MKGKTRVVVIGSGISGLTCGAFLARAGMKVRVVEQHAKIGGYAHSFTRGRYRFESGIHSVPLAPDGFIFHLLKLLGIEHLIEPIAHASMYSFTAGRERYEVPARMEDLSRKLLGDFPRERENLVRFFDDSRRFYDELILPLFSFEERFVDKNREFIARYFNRSYEKHIRSFFTDERLCRILLSQWPFWGMHPANSPTIFCVLAFYVHAIEGSHHIAGGFSNFARALSQAITMRGGQVSVNAKVVRLVTDKWAVRSAVLENGEEIEGDIFVSNISPYHLHRVLIPEQARNKIFLRRLRGLRPSLSATAVYCGLRHRVDFPGGSTLDFWFSDPDYTRLYREIGSSGPSGEPHHLMLLHSPQITESPTMLLMSFCSEGAATDWHSEKKIRAEKMIAAAERLIPGFRSEIDHMEVGSPSTFERFTGNAGGALYGFENTKDIYGETKIPNTTHLSNLFQTGHWCKPGGGVWNVVECGYTAAQIILRGLPAA